jgi:diacylglycerol kinase (ATP)
LASIEGKTMVIVNPASAGGRGGRVWPDIARRLAGLGLSFDHHLTERPGHATTLARAGLERGYELVVAVGGDGTINEVVNGLLDPARGKVGVTLGIIAAGRGCDFIRTVGIPADIGAACSRLVEGTVTTVDLGLLEFQRGGKSERRCFVNVAGGGFDGEAANRSNRVPKFLGGTIPYVAGLLATLTTYRNKDVEMTLDGGPPHHLRVTSVLVANCRYFAGGMYLAPMADPSDGQLDVVVLNDLGKLEFLLAASKVYSGEHIHHPKVTIHRASRIEVRTGQEMLMQADGEILGGPPFIFQAMPGALPVLV